MSTGREPLPSDLATAHAMILAERAARLEAEARARDAEAEVSGVRLEIERLQAAARQDAARAVRPVLRARRQARSSSSSCSLPSSRRAWRRRRRQPRSPPRRRSLRRVRDALASRPAARCRRTCRASASSIPPLAPAPSAAARSASWARMSPRRSSASRGAGRWSSMCGRRSAAARCEAISQPPAPSHPIARGRAGPNLLALVLAAKYGQHLPLTRQSAIYAREGVEIDVSHAGGLGGCRGRQPDAAGRGGPGARLRGRAAARRRHHRAGAGQGADQDRPLVGLRPGRPAVRRARSAGSGVLLLARPRRACIPSATWPGSPASCRRTPMAGSTGSTSPNREPGPILEAACWAHARSKLYELAAIGKAPIAAEAVRRIDRAVRGRARRSRA